MFWTVSLKLFLCVVHFTEMNVLTLYGVRGLRLCPSQWRGGLVYKGMDKGSFDDVTSFILRRHQINLCLSLLKIYGPSSSSSTSSSSFASSQRKSAFQQPTNGVGWYVNQLLRVMAFFVESITCTMWHPMKMPYLHCLIFRKRLLPLNPVSHLCFVVREHRETRWAL